MRTAIFLFVLTVGLALVLKFVIARKYGDDVQGRFIERLNYIPSQKPKLLNQDNLAKWLSDEGNRSAIRGYVFPVLFPLDIVFLASLGLLLGVSSVGLASRFDFLTNVPVWVWWIFPALYILSDFAEDATIAAIFGSFAPLTEQSFRALRALTTIKLATIGMAIGQTIFLGGLYFLLFIFPASRHV
jgi:hypothetical protein